MTNDIKNAVIAVYDNHEQAESVVKKLLDAKIPMKSISVIGRGHHSEEKIAGFYNLGDRITYWGKYGAFWGALWGLLAGGVYLTVPVTGAVVVLGDFAIMVITAIEGAIAGGTLSALSGAFLSIGIPDNTILQYEQIVKDDGFLVMVRGTTEEVEYASNILGTSNAKQIDVHNYKDQATKENAI